MKASQTLRRPANWQDFESLCKKLWGEIWNCPEIQKNGRLGQNQSGVDVFGIPFDDKSYYGIQCKGKSEYNDEQYHHPQFTIQEIENEIKKAKTFEPALKKFYLATTALNDADIQAFIRRLNIEHRESGIFEVHLFCWESIVDLIDENKRTHDYYVNSKNYKTNQSVLVSFEDGHKEIVREPIFKKTIVNYVDLTQKPTSSSVYETISRQRAVAYSLVTAKTFSKKINKSFFNFNVKVHNTGEAPLEEYKVFLTFEGDIQKLTDKNYSLPLGLAIPNSYVETTYLWFESLSGKLIPIKPILVSDDVFFSKKIYIKTSPKESQVCIRWKLLSKDFKDEGLLTINVKPKIITVYEDIPIQPSTIIRRVEGQIEDYITDSDEDT